MYTVRSKYKTHHRICFMTDLILVKAYQHPEEDSEHDIKWKNVFKYRPLNFSSNDTSSIENWTLPDYGRLRSFRLYSNREYKK